MGKGRHLAVDLDDVTVDFFRGVISSIYQEFGVLIDKDACTTWDDNPVKSFPWKSYGYKSWWEWMKERDWLWAVFPAVPGAIGGIHALRESGHFVEALTSKPRWAEPWVWKWLGRWRPPFHRVTIVPTGESKSAWSDAELLIDDKPDNCKDFVLNGRKAILFSQPWNWDVNETKWRGMTRAHNWDDITFSKLYEEAA